MRIVNGRKVLADPLRCVNHSAAFNKLTPNRNNLRLGC
jgi:hypothetical protein